MMGELSYDEDDGPENQYLKFKFYLGHTHKENVLCCPKHAPLYRIKRNCKLMIGFTVVNLFIIAGKLIRLFTFDLDNRP